MVDPVSTNVLGSIPSFSASYLLNPLFTFVTVLFFLFTFAPLSD